MEPQLLYEGKHKCPICHADQMIIREYLYEAPNVGKLELSVWECQSCGYRLRDVKPLEFLTPIKLELKVEKEEDLGTIVYRSASADIIIPELEIEVTAGEAYQGVLTTIEGILEIILDQLGDNCKEEKCKKLEDAKNGKIPFTLIINDESGLSFIQSEKVKITQL
ncbi:MULTISPECIES: ZPR1 zinc finger domain-containing protein [unclassified Stygiolobus]|uniref:ZPR1 zinc finger domain-containing protein n=1 Tax=unclassified Stygiolobus TaxID=2824672 RepID=UPI00307EB52C